MFSPHRHTERCHAKHLPEEFNSGLRVQVKRFLQAGRTRNEPVYLWQALAKYPLPCMPFGHFKASAANESRAASVACKVAVRSPRLQKGSGGSWAPAGPSKSDSGPGVAAQGSRALPGSHGHEISSSEQAGTENSSGQTCHFPIAKLPGLGGCCCLCPAPWPKSLLEAPCGGGGGYWPGNISECMVKGTEEQAKREGAVPTVEPRSARLDGVCGRTGWACRQNKSWGQSR